MQQGSNQGSKTTPTETTSLSTGLAPLDAFLKIGNNVLELRGTDKTLDQILALIGWIGVCAIAHYYSYRLALARAIQIPVEIIDSSVTRNSIGVIDSFPIWIVAAVVPIPTLFGLYVSLENKIANSSWGKRNVGKKRSLSKVLAGTLMMFAGLFVYRLLYSTGWNWGGLAFSALIFCVSVSLLIHGTVGLTKLPTGEPVSVSIFIGAALTCLLGIWISFGFLLRCMSTSPIYERIPENFCDSLASATVVENQSRHGWLISRDEHFLTMREKMDGKFISVSVPISAIREISYHDRSSEIEEKHIAFPFCRRHHL